jgi:Restriction endonuclease
VTELLVEICVVEGWFSSPDDAREAAERWAARFLTRLRGVLSESNRLGRFCLHDFNSSSDYMVQGCAFIEMGVDTSQLQEAKRRRAAIGDYVVAINNVSPDEFEGMCRGMLAELGVDDPVVTPHSADEGIDFYGRLRLEGRIETVTALPGIYRSLAVWMVGQAKHYDAMQSGTPDIRAIVGAVQLARGKAYGSATDKYPDLKLRVCDPIFYLFFTTGEISSAGWRLLDQSGVIGMDGQMVAAFLADHGVGRVENQFDAGDFDRWLARHRAQ